MTNLSEIAASAVANAAIAFLYGAQRYTQPINIGTDHTVIDIENIIYTSSLTGTDAGQDN